MLYRGPVSLPAVTLISFTSVPPASFVKCSILASPRFRIAYMNINLETGL